MTLPALNQKQMISVLNNNGYNTISSKYWETDGIERVMMGNGKFNFAFRLKKFYFFPEVIYQFEKTIEIS